MDLEMRLAAETIGGDWRDLSLKRNRPLVRSLGLEAPGSEAVPAMQRARIGRHLARAAPDS